MTPLTIALTIVAVLFLALVLVFELVARVHYRPRRTPHTVDPGTCGIDFENVRFPAPEGGELYGWWIPGEKDAPVLILVHGWENNAGRLMRFIEKLHPHGYNLLAFDARAHGDSPDYAKPTVWMVTEDTLEAIRYARKRSDAPIGLIGFSLGGGGCINAAALDPAVGAVVTVGAMARPVDVMRIPFEKKGVPYPLVRLFFRYLEIRYRLNFEKIAPVNHIGKVQAPMLVIHGREDRIVLPDQGRQLFAAANPDRTELWEVTGLAHGQWDNVPGFFQRVHEFLQLSLRDL